MLAHRYYDQYQSDGRSEIRHNGGNPWVSLAVAIVHQAALDYERIGKEDSRFMQGMTIYKDEVVEFFRSEWFGLLTGWCEAIDHEQAIAFLERRVALGTNT